MKKFLALCTFAMVSAGIYGFVDMAGDVRRGTMIEYDRGDKSKPVTIERLKMSQGYKSTSVRGNFAVIDLKDKIANAKPEIVPPTPVISVSDFVGSNFSRSMPVEFYEPISSSEMVTDSTMEVPSADSTVVGTTSDQQISVAHALSQEPVYITATADVPVADTIKPAPEPIYEYYGRGNPAKHRRKEVVVMPSNDTTTTVKKDDL